MRYVIPSILQPQDEVCKKQPFLDNAHNIYVCNKRGTMFPVGPCQGPAKSAEAISSIVGYLPAGKDVSTEDEESPLVGSITWQRLVETVTD
jgi:hypothetical protein